MIAPVWFGKGFVNGVAVGHVDDSTFHTGMAAIGCGWHKAFFDDLNITATECDTAQ
eukprot:m.906862 g.906862  ORF g.906862 m.906862 type:complete len:56 (+) comp23708_c0_seq13:3056-3223(+)